ncbi:hypothetical protein AB3X09_11525 [Xanthomonas tesorieronis]
MKLDPVSAKAALILEVAMGKPARAMASSRRLRIDEQGEPLSDILRPAFPFPMMC